MGLHPTLVTIRRNLPSVARSMGFQARVTSGYRSPKKQAWLYDRYLRGLQPYPVAPPGTSDHEKGLAIDVVSTNPDKLVSLLTSVGLFWGGPSDPVHFSMIGRRRAAQPQIKQAYKSYREEVGSKIPSALSFIPGIGSIFSALSDPEAFGELAFSTLLDVITGPL